MPITQLLRLLNDNTTFHQPERKRGSFKSSARTRLPKLLEQKWLKGTFVSGLAGVASPNVDQGDNRSPTMIKDTSDVRVTWEFLCIILYQQGGGGGLARLRATLRHLNVVAVNACPVDIAVCFYSRWVKYRKWSVTLSNMVSPNIAVIVRLSPRLGTEGEVYWCPRANGF